MARRVVTEEIQETPTTGVVTAQRSEYYRAGNILYIIFGLLELLLLARFIFLVLGANRGSGFVNFIYVLTEPFVAPFYGIFGQANYAQATFDPATLIAMVVYAILAWVIMRIIAAVSNRPADPV